MILEMIISAAVSAGVAVCMPPVRRRQPKTTVHRLQRRPATRHGSMPQRPRLIVDQVADDYQPSAVYVPSDDYLNHTVDSWTPGPEYSEASPVRPFYSAPTGAPEGVMPPA